MARWRNDYYYFPPSTPRKAKGGIKAQTKRGAFGQTWWAKRWIHVLESFDIGARLNRGRSYARRGQVISIDMDKGVVKAQVQGSYPEPYQVDIRIPVIPEKDWEKLGQALSEQALFAAKLLAGEMPEKIEEVFGRVNLSLFPEKTGDLKTKCSCPDWSNPCKHIAAVYYIIGEEFDRDPFLLFKLRGQSRDELLAKLGGRIDAAPPGETGETPAVPIPDSPRSDPEPLPADPDVFWAVDENLGDTLPGSVQIPQVDGTLLQRLGSFPFWRGADGFFPVLKDVYRRASDAGLKTLLRGRG
jgi:uncharacterized Zn finger protein